MSNPNLISLREKARKLPLKPGVYIMKDKTGSVIYVGKAVKLKNRVSSYFVGSHNEKTEAMVSRVSDFDVIVAGSEFEALVLENSLIKHHMPKYNILLKDDKGYPFIRIDLREEYPEFSVVNRTGNDGAGYYGPYGSRGTTFRAIDAVSKALKLPTCGKHFPRDIGKDRPCLNYHMKNCAGYCQSRDSQEEYHKNMETAVKIFTGKTDDLIRELTAEMSEDAEQLRFELAAEKRDRIQAITALKTKQRVVAGSAADTDAVGFYFGTARGCFAVLHYTEGNLLDKDYVLLDTPLEPLEEELDVLLCRYYEKRGHVPANILLPYEPQNANSLSQWLNQLGKTELMKPQRGEKLRLVEAALTNAVEEAERASSKEEKQLKVLEWLQQTLLLPGIPERIEAFDISNTGNDNIVAGMTVFIHGKPLKKDYRRFKMKTVNGQDDYHSMQEAVNRRFARFRSGDAGFSALPDILLIDGGDVHAGFAMQGMVEQGVDVPVFGMVKDDKHRTKALITPEGKEIGIQGNPAVFAFIGSIQEETHRFAIEYQRKLQTKGMGNSLLDEIPGVGEKRKATLLKAFCSVKRIKEASEAELGKVVDKRTAKAIYSHFHKEVQTEVGESDA